MKLVSMLALAAVTMPSAALAQRADDRFYARGGAFFSNIDSSLRIDGNGGANLGTELDLESDLGLPKRQVLPFGLAGWRFSDNWRLELEYFSLSRSEDVTLDRTIVVGETTYNVNGEVGFGLDTDIYRVAVGYSFVNHPGLELGADIGFHLSDFAVFIEGSGSVGGAPAVVSREERSQLVPLPTLGLYGRFDLNDTFALVGRADYFSLKISDYRGQLIDVSAGVTARIRKNIGIGADFRYVDYQLRASADNFTGKVDYNFYGPFIYLEVGF